MWFLQKHVVFPNEGFDHLGEICTNGDITCGLTETCDFPKIEVGQRGGILDLSLKNYFIIIFLFIFKKRLCCVGVKKLPFHKVIIPANCV